MNKQLFMVEGVNLYKKQPWSRKRKKKKLFS